MVGPTAVGKTAVGLALAAHWPLEIVSADSRQIYRRLDIGTAKPTRKERARVRITGSTCRSRARGTARATTRATPCTGWPTSAAAGRLPVVVGGTGLYIRALAEGLFQRAALDPARRRSLDAFTARLEPLELLRWAGRLDPGVPRRRTAAGGARHRGRAAHRPPLSYWQRPRARKRFWSRGTLCSPCPGRSCTSGSRGAPKKW